MVRCMTGVLPWNDLFIYKSDGSLVWTESCQARAWRGKKAGSLSCSTGYLQVWFRKKIKPTLVHRIVWEIHFGKIPRHMKIDHINRIKTDNRIENLRIVSNQQNSMNRGPVKSKKRTSLYKGVYFYRRLAKYMARIGFNRKTIFIGYYETEQDAARAYNAKAKELYGDHAYLNEVPCGR